MSLYTDLLADPTARRNILVEVEPYDLSTDSTTILRFSTNGFKTTAADTPASTYYDERVEGEFAVKRSIYSRGRIGGTSQSGYGSIKLINTDGELDTWKDDYSFSGRKVTIRVVGDVGFTVDSDGDGSFDSATDAGVRFTGTIDGEPSMGLDLVTLKVSDVKKLLETETISPVYATGVDGIILDGTGRATLAPAANVDITGDMVASIRIKVTSSGSKTLFGWFPGATEWPWQLNKVNTGAIRFTYTHSSGTIASATSTSTDMWTIDTWYSIGFSIVDDQLYFFSVNLSDRSEDTIWDGPHTLAVSTRDANSGGVLSIGHSAAGFIGYVSEARVYAGDMGFTALDPEAARRHIEQRAWATVPVDDSVSGPTLITNIEGYWPCNEGTGTTLFDGTSNGYDLAVAGGHSWDHQMLGGEDIAGQNVPTSIGRVDRCKATLIDASILVYQWHSRSVSAVRGLTENGGDIFPDHITAPPTWTNGGDFESTGASPPPPYLNDAPDLATFLSTPPATGTYTVFNELGYIRLGSSPSGTVLVDGKGDSEGGYVDDQGLVLERYLRDFTVIKAGDLDLTAYKAATSGIQCGIHIPSGSTPTAVSIVDEIIAPRGFWYPSRTNGKISAATFDEPDGTTGTIHELTEADIQDIKPKQLSAPTQGQKVGYNRTHNVLSPESVFGHANDDEIDLFVNEFRWKVFIEGSIAKKYLQSGDLIEVPTALFEADDAFREGVIRQSLYGKVRDLWTVKLLVEPQTMEVGEQVGLTWNGPNPRFGLATTRYFRIVEFDERASSITVWG